MADSVNKRKIMIAMDGSEYSEGALKCKYFYRFFSEVFFFHRVVVWMLIQAYTYGVVTRFKRIVDKDRILWIVLFTYKQCIRLFTYPASKQLKVSNRHNNKSCLILFFLNLFLDFCFILGFAKNMYQKDRDEVIVLHVTDHRNSSSFGCKLL